MNPAANCLLQALALPEATRINQRIAKKLLLEQGAPSPADRRRIQEGLEELQWVAVLKPVNVAVPEYCDATRAYGEISVLVASLRPGANASHLAGWIHRAIPYPVVLVAAQGDRATVSLAHKRFSEAEAGRVVAEAMEMTAPLPAQPSSRHESDFLSSLALTVQPAQNLLTVYEGWLGRVVALAVARLSGQFSVRETPGAYAATRDTLTACESLQRKIQSLRARAAKETQISRRVELNLELRRAGVELVRLTGLLAPPPPPDEKPQTNHPQDHRLPQQPR